MSVIVSLEDGVLRLTLHREADRNALDSSMAAALLQEFARQDVRCFLLEGAGQVFCGGGGAELPEELFRIREWISKPIVCAVQGAALGAGMGLIANAHVVVAAQGTSFGLTEVRTGGWPIGMRALRSAIGDRRAVELALTGRVFGAPEALQMGLVHELAPAFEFDDRAEALARHLAGLQLEGRLPVT